MFPRRVEESTLNIDSRDLEVSFSMHDILINNSWIRKKKVDENFSRLLSSSSSFFFNKKIRTVISTFSSASKREVSLTLTLIIYSN